MKRLICVFLCISCIISAFFIPVSADESDSTYRYFYEQLNENGKKIYDAILSVEPENATIKIASFEQKTDSTEMPEQINDYLGTISGNYQPAIDALLLDDPMMFWLKIGSDGGTTISYTHSYKSDFDFETWETFYNHTVEVNLNIVVAPEYADAEKCIEDINKTVDDFSTLHTEKVDVLKDIHEFLCDRLEYDTNSEGKYSHTVYGSLGSADGLCVCEGYAKALKLLCDRYGIKCVNVFGDSINSAGNNEAHMWNYVEIDDVWYAVDVTWDDQDGTAFLDYFLSGSSTPAEHFGNSVFESSHLPKGDYSGTGIMEFVLPKLSENAYDFGGEKEPDVPNDVVFAKSGNYGENVHGYINGMIPGIKALSFELHFGGAVTACNSDGCMLEDDTILTTGCKIFTGNECYIMIIPGDIDGNGETSTSDYVFIKRFVIKHGAYKNSDYADNDFNCDGKVDGSDFIAFKAADVDGDGRLTAVDYLCVKRSIIGTFDIYEHLASLAK